MSLCTCPPNATLTTVTDYECGIDFDQIVRLSFSKNQANQFPTLAGAGGIQVKASWDTLKAAGDDTKVILTPPTVNLTIPASEGQETGGNDNSTIKGIPNYLGENPVLVTGEINSMPAAQYLELKDFVCQSKSNIGKALTMVYLFNQFDQVIYDDEGLDGTELKGFPIYNFRISTPSTEGFNALNKFTFSFWMAADWADQFSITELDFDPLTEI